MDFPITRNVIGRIADPVNRMAELLPYPEQKPIGDGAFFWVYPEQSAEVVQVAKAVRMTGGLHGAWRLADEGLIVEANTLLRVVSDCALEIIFLGEGIKEGTFNTSQQKFMEQFFAPHPENAEEFAQRARESFIRREKMIAAQVRLFNFGKDADDLARKMAFQNKIFDSYVHGAYLTALEVFNGQRFMIEGLKSENHILPTKTMIAEKCIAALAALAVMAINRNLPDLVKQIMDDREQLRHEIDAVGAPH